MENSDAGSYVCTVSGESVSVMSDTATLIYYGMKYLYMYIYFLSIYLTLLTFLAVWWMHLNPAQYIICKLSNKWSEVCEYNLDCMTMSADPSHRLDNEVKSLTEIENALARRWYVSSLKWKKAKNSAKQVDILISKNQAL